MRRTLVLLLLAALAACSSRATRRMEAVPPGVQRLSVEQVARLTPPKVKDRRGWAQDVLHALEENGLAPVPTNVCSVLAIIEQESGYQANPVVPGLAKIVQARLDAYASKLGPLGQPALRALLDGKAKGHKQPFHERLKHVKTEQDLDVLFREIVAYYENEFPTTFAVANLLGGIFTATHIEDLNPITTAGSMQVSVRYAVRVGRQRGRGPDEIRDALYTRKGGVSYGTARLMGYPAQYEKPIYRFADYNAGVYASRNAALQKQVSELTGIKLVTDGDLLAYDRNESPTDAETKTMQALDAFRRKYAPGLSARELRRDAEREKEESFEATETWRVVKEAYRKTLGKAAPYAQVPEVVIKSPKMSKERSTSWYAKNVNVRFESCLSRAQALDEV
ncbi:MAG: DUF1615 family protein [Myxococcota bacterium]